MPDFLKHYYDTEGPFGLPMKDRQAQSLDAIVRALPRESPYEPQLVLSTKGASELLAGERADVSWISEESVDRQGDIVVAAGMDDSHFQLNPLVTMQHAYWMPPVGRSLWRKRVKDGPFVGIKAKTQYPGRPASWPADADWPPDTAFTLVQNGLLRGKSVGFLPTKARRPSEEEITEEPSMARVRFIIEKWILLEYACVFLPAQQHALVESVSKGLQVPADFRRVMGLPEAVVSFTPLAEIEKTIARSFAGLQVERLIHQALHESWSRLCGRV